jgi:hypothetical protein
MFLSLCNASLFLSLRNKSDTVLFLSLCATQVWFSLEECTQLVVMLLSLYLSMQLKSKLFLSLYVQRKACFSIYTTQVCFSLYATEVKQPARGNVSLSMQLKPSEPSEPSLSQHSVSLQSRIISDRAVKNGCGGAVFPSCPARWFAA